MGSRIQRYPWHWHPVQRFSNIPRPWHPRRSLNCQKDGQAAKMSSSNISLLSFMVLSIAVLSLAQTGPQAALIPACVVRSKWFRNRQIHPDTPLTVQQKSCDPAAIASVDCTNEDQYCHCVRQDGILSNISACANDECESPSRDIYGTSPHLAPLL